MPIPGSSAGQSYGYPTDRAASAGYTTSGTPPAGAPGAPGGGGGLRALLAMLMGQPDPTTTGSTGSPFKLPPNAFPPAPDPSLPTTAPIPPVRPNPPAALRQPATGLTY